MSHARPSSPRSLTILARLTLLALLALAVPALHVAHADGAGVTKSYPDKNFSLVVPKGWTIEEPSAEDKAAGYVLVARRTLSLDAYASAWFLERAAGTTTLDTALAETKAKRLANLAEPDVLEPQGMSWAGSNDAKFMKILGKSGTSRVATLVYGLVAAGRYHQLEIRAFGGAEDTLSEEFDAIGNGVKLLKVPPPTAPGPAPAPTPGDKPEGTPPAGPEAGGDGQPAAEAANAKRFEKFHMTWKLPKPPAEGEGPRWVFGTGDNVKPDLSPGESGLLALVGVPAEEGQPLPLRVELAVQKADPAATAKGIVNNESNFSKMRDNFQGAVAPNIEEEVAVGNWRGAARTFSGKAKDGGKPLYVKIYFAVLDEVLYQLQVVGIDGNEQKWRASLQETIAGLKWDVVGEGIRGPWVAPFPAVAKDRKDAIEGGVDAPFEHSTVTLKKPAAFRRIPFNATEADYATWIFGAEARKGETYLFVGIRRFLMGDLQKASPPREPDSLIDDLEAAWKSALSDPKTLTQKAGKANKSPATLSGAKGSTYRFEGSGDGTPFVEVGYVVKSSQNVFVIRAQFGGKDAETVLGADWKALLKSIKFK